MDVKNIGHGTVSEDKKRWRRYYRTLMWRIGAMPTFYCGGMSNDTKHIKVEKRLSPERFSTNYKTREEFENDRGKIIEYLMNEEYAPEDLVNKVVETVKELDLQFGE